jgi:hypothetical protein
MPDGTHDPMRTFELHSIVAAVFGSLRGVLSACTADAERREGCHRGGSGQPNPHND